MKIFQSIILLFYTAFVLVGCSNEETNENKKPNILFFVIDDQRNETLGCYGHPIVKSPNIDKLAKNGVRFTNAFVSNSVCFASRATMFTGLTCRTNGVSGYAETPLDTVFAQDVYPRVLKRNGYRTGFIGKFGFVLQDKKSPEYWFDYYKPVDRNPYFKKMEDGTLKHETELDGDYAIDFLKTQSKDQPFCLSVNFNASHAEDGDLRPGIGHYPWIKEVDGMYEDITIPEPRLGDSAIFNSQPKFLRESLNRIRYYWRWDTPEKYQTNMRAYYRMITGVDYTIGRVLKELEEQGLAENTIIVYVADNGYYMGDRGFAGKWSHYEQSLRVPMIIYDPRQPKENKGLVRDEMVLNLDLPATFIDMAGFKIPKEYQGKSLTPIVNNEEPKNWRESFFVEHLMPYKLIPKWEGVHTKQYVYARYFEQEPVYEFLHDLKKDPDELSNFIDDKSMKEVLQKLRVECDSYIEEYSKK